MLDQETINMISQVGFPIVVCLYLLYDRFKNDGTRCNRDIELATSMGKIATIIDERLPDLKRGD